MTKKHFIALADTIRQHNETVTSHGFPRQKFTSTQLDALADWCQTQNPRFMRERWFGYIAGTNGSNGGGVRERTQGQ